MIAAPNSYNYQFSGGTMIVGREDETTTAKKNTLQQDTKQNNEKKEKRKKKALRVSLSGKPPNSMAVDCRHW